MIGIVDVGGTKLLASVSADGKTVGDIIRRESADQDLVATIVEMLEEARDGEALSAITMSVPGPFDREQRALVNPPGLPQSWWGTNFATTLGAHYDCPVVVENDANCSALAEAVAGAGRDFQTVLYYTVSTGVGSGFVRDRRLIISRHDTEGGHQVVWPAWVGGPDCRCGGKGCLEVLVSGLAIENRYGVTPEHLEDPQAWDEIGRWLGLAAVNATALLDPDVIVFGGGVCNAWERFSPALHKTIKESLFLQPSPAIALAELQEGRNNLIGALANLANANDAN